MASPASTENHECRLRAQPFGRILVPRDAAVLTAYLLGDDSMLMTGSVIDFDQNVICAYD